MEDVINSVKCKNCNSSQTYFRTKTQDFHCIKCGENFKKEGDGKQ